MTVLLRAALVIGALSYLALMRAGTDPAAEARGLAGSVPKIAAALPSTVPSTLPSIPPGALPAALAAIPPETRERMARGLMAELSRRAGAEEPASRDTLEEADRRPAWRGTEVR